MKPVTFGMLFLVLVAQLYNFYQWQSKSKKYQCLCIRIHTQNTVLRAYARTQQQYTHRKVLQIRKIVFEYLKLVYLFRAFVTYVVGRKVIIVSTYSLFSHALYTRVHRGHSWESKRKIQLLYPACTVLHMPTCVDCSTRTISMCVHPGRHSKKIL